AVAPRGFPNSTSDPTRSSLAERRLEATAAQRWEDSMAHSPAEQASTPVERKPFYHILYVQVLIAIVLGALVGWLLPGLATSDWVKALGDGFIKLIRMLIAPIIFCTVVSGISHIQDARKVGRVGVKALVYFEIISTFALALGLLIGNIIRPGAGFGTVALDP